MFPETPVPLHVPPVVPVIKVLRFMLPDDSQMAPGEVHAGSTSVTTVIVCVKLPDKVSYQQCR